MLRPSRNHPRFDGPSLCFAALWLFIAFVSVHDGYLVAVRSDVIGDVEQNPVGRYLIALNDGRVWMFLAAKCIGTIAACTLLLQLYLHRRELALAVAGPLSGFQLWLLWYLLFK